MFWHPFGKATPITQNKNLNIMKNRRPQYPYAKKITTIHLENAEKESQSKEKPRNTKQYLLYGALGAAGALVLYAGSQMPFVRNVALPYIASVASKNWGLLMGNAPVGEVAA
jgi:hypothetical protein